MKTHSLLLAPLAFLFACNSHENVLDATFNENTTLPSAIETIAGLQDQSHRFAVDAIRQDTVLLPNGGSIVFKDHSFVDENGNAVTGEVNISWKEFHSLSDIALSGIPMKYDSSGVQYDLVSGGMFTISASQNNKTVELAPGKPAEINLVSQQDTPCYNFYELDEKTGQWDYQSTASGQRIEEEVKRETPKLLRDQLLDMAVDVRNTPELKSEQIAGWIPVDNLSDEDRDWLKSNYAATKLIRSNADGTYQVEVRIGKRKEELRLKPYTTLDARKDTQAREQKLNREMNEIMAYQKKLAAGKVVRSIEISNFGTFNWDIAYKRKNGVILAAEFEFPVDVKKRLVHLFLVSPDENAIVRYDATGSDRFSYDPNLRNCLIALMPDNRLMVVDNASFKNSRKTGNNGKPKAIFEFEDTGVKVQSSNDIELHLPKFI